MEYDVRAPERRSPGPSKTLLRELDRLVAGSSSAAHQAVSTQSGLPPSDRVHTLRRKRADDSRIAQLRGVFAAFDLDRDGLLSSDELDRALLSLGIRSVPDVVALYTQHNRSRLVGAPRELSSPRRVDLDTFIYVTLNKLPAANYIDTTERDMIAACRVFDPLNTGKISLESLLHLLCEVDTASSDALSAEEVTELLRMTGILTPEQVSRVQGGDTSSASMASMEVAYAPLIRRLIFRIQDEPTGTGTSAASSRRS